ncbi:MAG: Rrf2 family transcriptional regulator [bacterium]
MVGISTRGRYGLRALIAIVKAEIPLSTAQIAHKENLSPPYLEQIFNRLKRAGVIKAKRGARGGYLLSRPADQITVGDVIEILDGPVTFSHCHNPEEAEHCERAPICPSRIFWSSLESDINAKLYGTTLQDLKEMEQGLLAARKG